MFNKKINIVLGGAVMGGGMFKMYCMKFPMN